ncbi:spermatogenesis-associated protein 2-like protein [Microcaecilia unicolor]|uniref:Spermatogenesis-associated protein 2-like protein n=1 Tax=Microcaecilia unicolor TaxID=1415580 RepID=A0A6P7XYJ2_9AMPH|nr:spermatogenesis-associated protein 2-like protein [Microcaecilia unicolor]
MNADAFLEMYMNYRARNLSQDDSSSYSTNTDFMALLRQSLVADPELHRALQNGAFEVIGSSQLEHRDLRAQLVMLTRAFCLLEEAALNLYYYPWRKEFRTIKTFSGDYVHFLKPVLSKKDVARMLGKLGYVMRRDAHGFVAESFPSASELLKVACGFLAVQLECEILAEIQSEQDLGTVPIADVILVRRGSLGIEACGERLQRLTLQLEKRDVDSALSDLQPAADYLDNLDIYRDAKETPDTGHVPWGLSSARTLCSLAESDSLLPRYQPQFCDSCHEPWDSHLGRPCPLTYKGNETVLYPSECYRPSKYLTPPGDEVGFTTDDYYSASVSPERDTSKTLSQSSDSRGPGTPIRIPLPDGGTYTLHDCMSKTPALVYKCQKCSTLHESECVALQGCRRVYHYVKSILPSEAAVILKYVEQQRYKAHSCLHGNNSPHYQCKTCRELHYIKCSVTEACRKANHPVKVLFREQDQVWWLRQIERDAVLVKGLSETQTQNL